MPRGIRVLVLLLALGALVIGAWAVWGGSRALDGTSWRLTRWSEPSLDPAGFTITASFARGTVSGRSAVNSYSGPYTARRSGAFATGALASTEMAGPEPAMRAEAAYFNLLARARAFSRTAASLTLRDATGAELLVFEPAR